jgi:two-component system, NtrC family, response regulator AtoC
MKILIVDEEESINPPLRERLVREGYELVEAVDGESIREALEGEVPHLVLLDIRLPGTDGIRMLRSIQEQIPDLPVIIITASVSVDQAVQAMKLGAFDYVAKPFNLDELTITVKRALESAKLRRVVGLHVRQQKARYGVQNLVGCSSAMEEVRSLILKVSRSQATMVLARGESGTGKDLVAKAIHAESSRVAEPFVNITCTALQETLLESELFGHEKGSFTDAKTLKKGLFELANGGTVLMDEIGDMGLALQGKLLRVLEEKAFKRIGGTQDIRVDVRVIASTNRNLEQLIEQKRFREDLYYRLNVITIDVPPLRDRREDVAPLTEHFLKHFSLEFRKEKAGITRQAMEMLRTYDWPGNVRELRNVIERAVLLGPGSEVSIDDILLGRPPAAQEPGRRLVSIPPRGLTFDEIEKDLIVQALERVQGNQTKAAELLGMTRDKIHYRMEKYGLLDPTPGPSR